MLASTASYSRASGSFKPGWSLPSTYSLLRFPSKTDRILVPTVRRTADPFRQRRPLLPLRLLNLHLAGPGTRNIPYICPRATLAPVYFSIPRRIEQRMQIHYKFVCFRAICHCDLQSYLFIFRSKIPRFGPITTFQVDRALSPAASGPPASCSSPGNEWIRVGDKTSSEQILQALILFFLGHRDWAERHGARANLLRLIAARALAPNARCDIAARRTLPSARLFPLRPGSRSRPGG